MADDNEQSGTVGESGRGKRSDAAENQRVESRKGAASQAQVNERGSVKVDLSSLDPSKNGVLDSLKRIEKNTAGSTNAGGARRREPKADAVPPRDARGRLSSGTSRSDLRRDTVLRTRVEREVFKATPVTPDQQVASATQTSEPRKKTPAARTREASAPSDANKKERAPRKNAEASAKDKPLTLEQLRRLPLRGDNGKFLSTDEKQGMSPAQLAQARARQQRNRTEEEKSERGLASRIGGIVEKTMGGNQSTAVDAAGSAAGGIYYGAAKEAANAYEELAGKESKARKAYDWLKDKRSEKKTKGDDAGADTLTGQDAEHHARAQTNAIDETGKENVRELEKLREATTDGLKAVVKEIDDIPAVGGGQGGIVDSALDMMGGRKTPKGAGARGKGGRFRRAATKIKSGGKGLLGLGEKGAARAVAGASAKMAAKGAAVAGGVAAANAASAGTQAATQTATRGAATATEQVATKGAASAGRNVLRVGGKVLGAAAAPLSGYMAFQDAKAGVADRDDLTGKQKNTIAGGAAVGAGGGALAGAAAGGMAGAALGSVVPIVGTAAGGLLGSIIGGIAGSMGGESVGKTVGEAVSSLMDNVEEDAAKALDNREKRNAREAAGVTWYNPMTWGNNRKSHTSTSSAKSGQGGEADRSLLTRDDLGRVSEKYESAGRGVGVVSSGKGDAGGVSYGTYQLASKTGTMAAYLKSEEGSKYAERFEGLKPGSAEFNKVYKDVAANDKEGFAQSQHDYIKRTHYDPVATYAQAKGMDVNDPAIQEALWSQSVQHSGRGNREIIDNATAQSSGGSSEETINALYDARGNYARKFASSAATTERYSRERKDVLAIAANEKARASEARNIASSTPANDPVMVPAKANPKTATASAVPTAIARPTQVAMASASAPMITSVEATPVDPRLAAKALRPQAPAAPAAPATARAPARGPVEVASANQGSRDGKNGARGKDGKDEKEGLHAVRTDFDDTVLTLMAMDRI